MKYDKDAVVKLIESVIVKAEEAEESKYRDARKVYKNQIRQIEEARNVAETFVSEIQQIDISSLSEFWDAAQKSMKKLRVPARYGRSTAVNSLDQLFNIVAVTEAPQRPERSTERSDRLKATLEIFKTGAPPEVGVTDLKSFGFMEYVKRGGL